MLLFCAKPSLWSLLNFYLDSLVGSKDLFVPQTFVNRFISKIVFFFSTNESLATRLTFWLLSSNFMKHQLFFNMKKLLFFFCLSHPSTLFLRSWLTIQPKFASTSNVKVWLYPLVKLFVAGSSPVFFAGYQRKIVF